MSRSYRKCNSIKKNSEKAWKKQGHHKFRAKQREAINVQTKYGDVDMIFPIIDEVVNPWDSPSDGMKGSGHMSFEEYYQNELKWWHKWRYLFYDAPNREDCYKQWKKFTSK